MVDQVKMIVKMTILKRKALKRLIRSVEIVSEHSKFWSFALTCSGQNKRYRCRFCSIQTFKSLCKISLGFLLVKRNSILYTVRKHCAKLELKMVTRLISRLHLVYVPFVVFLSHRITFFLSQNQEDLSNMTILYILAHHIHGVSFMQLTVILETIFQRIKMWWG